MNVNANITLEELNLILERRNIPVDNRHPICIDGFTIYTPHKEIAEFINKEIEEYLAYYVMQKVEDNPMKYTPSINFTPNDLSKRSRHDDTKYNKITLSYFKGPHMGSVYLIAFFDDNLNLEAIGYENASGDMYVQTIEDTLAKSRDQLAGIYGVMDRFRVRGLGLQKSIKVDKEKQLKGIKFLNRRIKVKPEIAKDLQEAIDSLIYNAQSKAMKYECKRGWSEREANSIYIESSNWGSRTRDEREFTLKIQQSIPSNDTENPREKFYTLNTLNPYVDKYGNNSRTFNFVINDSTKELLRWNFGLYDYGKSHETYEISSKFADEESNKINAMELVDAIKYINMHYV